MKKIWIIIAAVMTIGYAAWTGINYFLETYITNTAYEARESYESIFEKSDIDFEELKSINPDCIGWINYEDCGIDEPIVQGGSEYINITFEGEESSAGSIFILEEDGTDFTQFNTIIYGNALNSGEMFGNLKNIYQNPEKYYKNPYIYIYLPDGSILTYRVFSVYITEAESDMYSIPLNKEANKEYIQKALAYGDMSGYIELTGEEIKALENGNDIITLSTRYGNNKRLLVHAVKING